MTMRSSTAPRRIYRRAGSLLVCFGGLYYGPTKNSPSTMSEDKEVKIEQLEKSGGKHRIQVTQKAGKNPAIVETWIEKVVEFKPRGEKAASKSA